MTRRPRPTLVASLLAAACLGAGGGAVAYATLSSDGNTVVRQVTVQSSEPIASSSEPLSVNTVYRRANRGVVEITVGRAQGSGWVYDSEGHVVTNQHVVADGGPIRVRFWNGRTYSATVVGSDLSTDLAVLDVDAPASVLHPLQLADSSKLRVGDEVVAIGSPFGLEGTVTSGIVSALHRAIQAQNNFTINDSIQTDAAINHGNSGGPLLNARGQVVGVNAQIRSDSGGNEGVGFAIPSNTVRSIATQLIESGRAVHAYLGVSISATSVRARIAEIKPSTPADGAGLRAGDVITAVDGTRIASGDDLTRAIDSHKPNDRVRLTIERGGESRTVEVTLSTRPS